MAESLPLEVRRSRPPAWLRTGPALGVPSFREGLSVSSPGASRPAETTRPVDPRTCKLWVTALLLGHSVPLAWGNRPVLPIRPQEMPALSP